MIATVKVDETPAVLYVKKFRALCDMHSVRFGSTDSFSAFMRQLAEDRKFAMDFWALAGKFSNREGGQLSDEQMLNAIVQEIAGCSVTAADDKLKPQINDFARILAGEDVSSPVVHEEDEVVVASPAAVPPPPMKAIETSTSQPSAAPAFSRSSERISEQAFNSDLKSSPLPEPDARVEDQLTSGLDDHTSSREPGLTQHQLDEALLRLELNSLELKLHLDNIDSRMSRMEPHLEELASKVSGVRDRESAGRIAAGPITRPEQVREPITEPVREKSRPMQESVGRAVEKSRLVLEPQPVPVINSADDDDPSIPIPLQGYSQRRISRSVGLFAALLLVGVGGFFFLHRQYGASLWADFGPSLHERYDAALHELHGAVKGRAADGSGSVEVSSATGSGSAAANNGSPAQDAPPASAQVASAPVVSEPAEQNTNEPTKAVTESQAAVSKTDAHLRHKSHAVAVPEEPELVETSKGVSDGGLEGPVSVAPAVMEENLVVSRVPAYPDVAKADRVEGPVVMQAIITKNGTVGHLHVLQGDPMLRSAASEAVSKWRYRPYTVNGKPVEVATTVTVDFKLNR
jgi:TonB family protein